MTPEDQRYLDADERFNRRPWAYRMAWEALTFPLWLMFFLLHVLACAWFGEEYEYYHASGRGYKKNGPGSDP